MVLAREYGPSVQLPTDVDPHGYERQLFERWVNTALGHRTAQVGTDGSVKLRQRVPGPALLALERGEVPHLIALTVAGYLACLAPLPGFDPGPHARAMVDGAAGRLREAAARAKGGVDLARAAIADLELLGRELAGRSEFVDRVGELVDVIASAGVRVAIRDSVSASSEVRAR